MLIMAVPCSDGLICVSAFSDRFNMPSDFLVPVVPVVRLYKLP